MSIVTEKLRFARVWMAATVTVALLLTVNQQLHAADEHKHAAAEPKPAKDEHDEHDEHAEPDAHGGHSDEVTLTAEAIKSSGIAVGVASKQPLVPTFIAPARVGFNTDAMAHVGSVVAGRVAELKVKLGDAVKTGDPLVVVESPDLGEAQSDFLLKRTAAETAKPSSEIAKSAYDRAKLLLDQSQGIALSEVQQREREWRNAAGDLRSAEASATAAENKLHLYGMSQEASEKLATTGEIEPRFTIRAPIAGQVVEREVTLGELVGPDRDSLLILADLDTLWVIADVPEARLGDLQIGARARVKVAALRGLTIDGSVTYISPALDPTTRSAKVRIEVKSAGSNLRPGMFAQAMISSAAAESAEPVLAIPEEAVQTVEGATAVFVPVEGEPGTFAKREVSIGAPIGGMVAVFSGLKEGESLVIANSFMLKAELGKSGAAHEH